MLSLMLLEQDALKEPHDTYVIFDRYVPNSTTARERAHHTLGAVHLNYQVSADTPLPCKDANMKISNNKQEVHFHSSRG